MQLEKFSYEPEYEDVPEIIELDSEEVQNDASIERIETDAEKTISVADSYQLEIVYGETPQINISLLPNVQETPAIEYPGGEIEIISCPRLLTPPQNNSFTEKQKNLTSILKKVTRNLDDTDNTPLKQRKSVNFILPPPTKSKFQIPFALSQKFFIVIESFFADYCKKFKFKRSKNNILPKVFIWTQSIDLYLQLVEISIKMSKKRSAETGEMPIKTKRSVSSEEFTNKMKKRLQETRNAIVQTDVNKCSVEKDCSFSYNYLERVKKALMENGDDDLFVEFMSLLRSFDPSKQSVPELYYVSVNYMKYKLNLILYR